MRIVFMGSPEFAIPSLSILLENNYDLPAVVTVPDKPQGRGQKVLYSAIKSFALEKGLKIFQPESLKEESFIKELKDLKPELFIVVAFRILPREVFTIPTYGSFNLHASILPKYRGAAPINWAIINGEKETGVTTFFLEEKVDTGNIILQARVPIKDDETAGELHDKLAEVGAEIVLHTVRLIEIGKANPKQQDNTFVTPAPKIFKEDCKINWDKTAVQIHNFVRGLSPLPSAYTKFKGKIIKIYKTKLENFNVVHTPGKVIEADKKLIVAAGQGTVQILELQLEGKKRLNIEEFLRGFQIEKGDEFE